MKQQPIIVTIVSKPKSHVAYTKSYPGAIGYGTTQKSATNQLIKVIKWAKDNNLINTKPSNLKVTTKEFELC